MKYKHFECDSGKLYKLPEEACVFCMFCTDIFWDYTHGIYALICDANKHEADFGNVPCICKHFQADLVCEDILENREGYNGKQGNTDI